MPHAPTRTVPHAALLAAALLLPLAGCLPGTDPPPPLPQTCNNNGICELEAGEDCAACEADCPCCNAVAATPEGPVNDPLAATGRADGAAATLAAGSSLVLLMGAPIIDGIGPDLEIHGEVLTQSSTTLDGHGCYPDVPSAGFEVFARATASSQWSRIGFWTRSIAGSAEPATTFQLDIDCAGLDEADAIRLVALGQAEATLLHVLAISCAQP